MKSYCKYLISFFIIVICCLLQQCCLAQSTTVRPYKFGFTIDEQQHRSEQRDERGIVMGEFGFITADGIYHVTVYATDEQGRFRILAMKNYPYESPPKTVEVMVQPKIPPTTTTAKPLPKNNFYNEACSGCFLTNGNGKPKGINGADGKTVKSDIRPLSKALPNAGSSSSSAGKPSTGNIFDTQHAPVLLSTTELPENLLNLPLIPTVAFKDLNELKSAVIAPLTFETKEFSLNTAKNKEAGRDHVLNVNPLALAPKIVAEVMANGNIMKTQSLALKDVVKTPMIIASTKTTQLHNAPHNQILHQNQALSNLNNNAHLFTGKPKTFTNIPNASKTKSITFLKQDLPTTDNILSKTPSTNSLIKPQVDSSETNSLQNSLEPPSDSETQGNVLQNPVVVQPTTFNKNSAKETVQKPTNIKPSNTRNTSTPTTVQKTQQTPSNTNKLPTTYTLTPTSTATSKPQQGSGKSPGSVSTATKTNTGNPPPIMDIIMQKVLPALLGNKGQKTPSTTTTLNNKPKAGPQSTKPSTGISASIPNKKYNGGSSSGSSSLNGDGDLYRFKYILDYHGHSETGKRNGNKQGSYFSIGDDDVERTIEYVANEFGYQPRIRWRKLDHNEIKSKENTLKDYEFIWFNQ